MNSQLYIPTALTPRTRRSHCLQIWLDSRIVLGSLQPEQSLSLLAIYHELGKQPNPTMSVPYLHLLPKSTIANGGNAIYAVCLFVLCLYCISELGLIFLLYAMDGKTNKECNYRYNVITCSTGLIKLITEIEHRKHLSNQDSQVLCQYRTERHCSGIYKHR
jgi:hypothetical protein